MSQNTPPVPPPTAASPGTVARREMGAEQLSRTGETSTALLIAQAEALVKVRFFVALQRPRDWDDVRTKLLKACERPGFAGSATEQTWGAAWFNKPVGKGVEGFSIRFAEEALRCMGNMDVETTPIFEDENKRILRVAVLDLEANVSIPTSVTVEKTVVRKFLKKGQEALKVMVNSVNERTFLVEASEDEVFQKQQALASKAIRNGVLRLLPGDIQAECRTRILAIRHGAAAKDPDGFRKTVADGFAKLNVLPSDIKKYLGHDLAKASPAQLTDLKALWVEITNGATTWAAALASALEDRDETPPETATQKPGLDGVADRLKETKVAACGHKKVPPSKVSKLKAGETLLCGECGANVSNPEATAQATLAE